MIFRYISAFLKNHGQIRCHYWRMTESKKQSHVTDEIFSLTQNLNLRVQKNAAQHNLELPINHLTMFENFLKLKTRFFFEGFFFSENHIYISIRYSVFVSVYSDYSMTSRKCSICPFMLVVVSVIVIVGRS